MKFFKYLVFIIISLISVPTFAYTTVPDGTAYCKSLNGPSSYYYRNGYYPDNKPLYMCAPGGQDFTIASCPEGETVVNGVCTKPPQCPEPGYPLYVYFDAGGKIPQQRCVPVQDKFCVYKAKPDSIVLNHQNDRQSTVLYNVSKTPVSSCTPLDEGQCDKKDPYGGCYQPPNDGCTRLADGSITCPDNSPPPDIKGTCGGQSYCNRPPTGCGSGYVSGSYNGQAICVKSSPSTGSGSGSGTGTGTGTGGEGSGTGTGTG
ncbi:hypothetical protein OHV85_18010, partial [Acinetobacter baumannii]|nr:hypothetical protein [Acinetobacter baumannii]